ncbi:HEAT repeat-containing protein 6 [Plutella xylostella]|uniref:HEAT repeat-containing protein 6 n=1 Tax=Plutella xylostella TaxID=51655 RepID=UPI0020323EE5|nr:HEAT repeat-containing protein 6 [Plutella xylostella]
MDKSLAKEFFEISEEICNILHLKHYEKSKINSLIDDLNSKPYKTHLFVSKHDATNLVSTLCRNIMPTDNLLTDKTSHLLNSIITKQNLQFNDDFLRNVLSWHMGCLKSCSIHILPDILYNTQCIIQYNPLAASPIIEDLIGKRGILLNYIKNFSSISLDNPLQITLLSLKCIGSITQICDDKSGELTNAISQEIKENLFQTVISFLQNGGCEIFKSDDFFYYKVVIAALRVLSQLCLHGHNVNIPLPELMGISKHFILLGLVPQPTRWTSIMPAQQTIAPVPIVHNTGGKGKKQKLRKHRNNAIDSLKKEIPVSDRSLMNDVGHFDNNSAYTPASLDFLDTPKGQTTAWPLTSDSDVSDIENAQEAKLIALKSRVRLSASNLMLVLVKVTEKRDMFGYWWALLPDSPDWSNCEASKETLTYCAVKDPIASCRANVLSVILSLLSGSKMYLSQAEISKKATESFIPFSVTLGFTITNLHKVLVSILDSERVASVNLVALKCCAALVQATPYHKMKEGLISELVRSCRKFLVHRDVTLQVGALITMGCVLSINPTVDEVLKSVEKDNVQTKSATSEHNATKSSLVDDDFEECYSDDEMFVATEENAVDDANTTHTHYFKSWILDICLKNMGWTFRGGEIVKCLPAPTPVILESLRVISAACTAHWAALAAARGAQLGALLGELLRQPELALQAARALAALAAASASSDETEESLPLTQLVPMWEKLITPLSAILQSPDNPPAKVAVCDCIANIGERCYKELPRRLQVVCCTLLVGSCSDEEAAVRAASVRALAMMLMYRTHREDIYFVCDCGENILRALAEPSLFVRTKAAWALGNLSDALVLNLEDPDIDDIDGDLLRRLLKVSVDCATDNDKVKMSAPRALGNILRLIKEQDLERDMELKPLCALAIRKLVDLTGKGNTMKVRWNACRAIGNVLKNDSMYTCFSGWENQVLPCLCVLSKECKNLKVRINAATALRAVRTRSLYGDQFAPVWRGVMAAMESAAIFDDFSEYKHKDNLTEQLCVTLSHMCCLLKQSDLADILDPLVFHYDCAKSLFTQLCHRLPPENPSCLVILEAAKYVTMSLTAESDAQQQALATLQEIFIWDM